MFKARNSAEENKKIKELINSDEKLMKQHELFLQEMNFKQQLIEARRAAELTQKEVSDFSGLSQQAISRLEKGSGGTLETIMKYLDAIGYSLTIQKQI